VTPSTAPSFRRGDPSPAGARATLLSLGWTLATGVVVAVKSAAPGLGVQWLPMQVVQPWHTLGAIAMLVAGVATLVGVVCRRIGSPATILERLVTPTTATLVLAGAIAIALGQGSGLEYLVWPRGLSFAPVGLLVLIAWSVWRRLDWLCGISPEGAWLLVMGATLAPLGMIERLLGSELIEPTRALMIEWHAMDTAFAGLNTALYGLGILCTAPVGGGRGLRSRGLYVVAVVALLSTFGHHHYGSGQPSLLKWTALGGSLLGMVSFARHIRVLRRARPARRSQVPTEPLEHAAGAWTLFAVGSGVLLAVPPVNHILHGTHAIVAHAMGAIIGVNVAVIMSGIIGVDRRHDPALQRAVRRATGLMQVALVLIVLDLAAAGLCRGIWRIDGTHRDHQPIVRAVLVPLPLLGLWLSVAMARLGWLAWNAVPRDGRGAEGPASPTPPAPGPSMQPERGESQG